MRTGEPRPSTDPETGALPRVALACPGAGVEQRGFERIFTDLPQVLGDAIDVTLFKGGGPRTNREVVLRFLRRNGRFLRWFPIHRLVGKTPIHAECMTFALALLPHLKSGRFDVVHVIDPPLAKVLFRMRAKLGLRFRLLYSEATSMPPSDYPPCDLLHHIGQVAYDDAIRYGRSPDRMTVLPPGIHSARFRPSAPREVLRQKHGVADTTFLILYVGAINRLQKRLHHLIEEAASVAGDVLIWIDGSMDQGDPSLIDMARDRLGARVRFSRVPSNTIGDLYAMADVMVLPSVFEAFGLVLAEALASGTPVLMHDAPHFRWLAPKAAHHVDMRAPGALASRLIELRDNPAAREELRDQRGALDRFDWALLVPRYVDMYRRMMQMAPLEAEGTDRVDASTVAGRQKRSRRTRVKFLISRVLRAVGLLGLADHAMYAMRRAGSSGRNRRFRRDHPGFATPPAHLAFDALNHTDWQTYRDSGVRHAGEFARIILDTTSSPSLDILEWGCGPGRLLRHMAGLLSGRKVSLTGSDYNPESIEWCRANLPGIEFVRNELAPPLPFPDGRFDVVYCFSVFTHLSEEMQVAWAKEIARVLRPGGVFICTTHGDRCRHLLTSVDEHMLYNCGQVVVQGNYREGRKWFLAIHPPQFVRETLLRPYEGVELRPITEPDLLQDFWVGRKPINAGT